MAEEYYKTKDSVSEYINAAKGYNGNALIQIMKEYLPTGSRVLELGSGPGEDWLLLSKDYEVLGSDFSDEFIRRLNMRFEGGKFLKLDARTIQTNLYFNGIYSNKVLHHLRDKELHQSIKRQHEILEQEGIICHSFWRGEGGEIFKGMFVNYHEKHDIRTLFEEHFEILYLEYYNEFEADDSILLIGRRL